MLEKGITHKEFFTQVEGIRKTLKGKAIPVTGRGGPIGL
jgi:hypothetical protein